MPSPQTCHLPYRFVNGRQRCSRCGTVLETESSTAQDTHFWVCRNDDETEGEFVGPGAALLGHQRKCQERPWRDVMGHVAGPADGNGNQPCSRCGEDLSWLFWSEPLRVGEECTVTIEANPGDHVSHSGSNSVKSGTVLCV
jgi:ribosomal protein S14